MPNLYVSSGGAQLNFGVVPYATESALPTAAPENTIGVITTTPITGYVFSSTQPSGLSEGEVWIMTNINSDWSINILKKNGLFVYPKGCSQVVNGVLVPKVAKLYQNGAWIDWYIYILKSGSATSLGAGIASGYQWFSGSTFYKTGSVSSGSGSITLNSVVDTIATGVAVSPTNKIDLTSYSRLTAVVSNRTSSGSDPGKVHLMVSTVRSGTSQYGSVVTQTATALSGLKAGSLLSVDISSLKSSYYIVLGACHSGNTYAQGGTISISNIYLS